MTIHCSHIVYDVSDEDLDFADDCKEAIVMPEELDIEVDDEDLDLFHEDPDDFLAKKISEETGWLVESFYYDDVFFQDDPYGNVGEGNSAKHDLN